MTNEGERLPEPLKAVSFLITINRIVSLFAARQHNNLGTCLCLLEYRLTVRSI